MVARTPNLFRWILLLPASLAAGFLAGGVIDLLTAGASSGPIAYAAAFLKGLAYVWAALHIAYRVAPSHKKIVVTVLGILILGDLSFVHLILQADLMPPLSVSPGEEGGLGVILGVLQADDYGGLPNAGVVKIAGVLTGCYIAWRMYVRSQTR